MFIVFCEMGKEKGHLHSCVKMWIYFCVQNRNTEKQVYPLGGYACKVFLKFYFLWLTLFYATDTILNEKKNSKTKPKQNT